MIRVIAAACLVLQMFLFAAASVAFGASGVSGASGARPPRQKPNVIIIFADDLGYGDLSCYGHPTIRTPNIDRMATEGQRWTDFYVAACVCTPSRAALLTGRLPVRSGMTSNKKRVLYPTSNGGLPGSEITLAEGLKQAGYATGLVGKWHLGHLPQYLPTSQGFDYYYGLPYSNDMSRVAGAPKGRALLEKPRIEYWDTPLMRGTEIIEQPVDQTTLTRRYTEEAIQFINQHKDEPFFLYMAHTMPHTPLFRSKPFENKSRRGLYGDVVEELDWSVGQVLQKLRDAELADNTLVVFTSDNGPWLIRNDLGGSAGLLREGKGSSYEGGMRVPFIAWWPGSIKPAIVSDIGSAMDLFVTGLKLAGGAVPTDRVIDGVDLTATLLEGKPSPRDHMLFYRHANLWAVRKGPFKAHFSTPIAYGDFEGTPHDPPLLFNLGVDPGESYNVAAEHPKVVAELKQLIEAHRRTVEPVENQMEK